VLKYTTAANHLLIVLGVGPSVTAVGKTLGSVPVFFGDRESLQPEYVYGRFLAAIDVDYNPNPGPAKLIGIVHAQDITEKWQALANNITGYYNY
jgi:hypothetical protein